MAEVSVVLLAGTYFHVEYALADLAEGEAPRERLHLSGVLDRRELTELGAPLASGANGLVVVAGREHADDEAAVMLGAERAVRPRYPKPDGTEAYR